MMKRKGLKIFLALILVVVEAIALWRGWKWMFTFIPVAVVVLVGGYLVLKHQERKIRAEYDETGEEDEQTEEICRHTRWPYVVAVIIIIIATIAAFIAWIFEVIAAMVIACAVVMVSIGSIIMIKVKRHHKDKKQEEPKKMQSIVSEDVVEACYKDFMTQ